MVKKKLKKIKLSKNFGKVKVNGNLKIVGGHIGGFKVGKKLEVKKTKSLYAICSNCSEQLYPSKALEKDAMNGITIHMGDCDICGEEADLTPIRDFIYALRGNPCKLMWD